METEKKVGLDEAPAEGTYYMVGPFTAKQVRWALVLAGAFLAEGAAVVWLLWTAAESLDQIRFALEVK